MCGITGFFSKKNLSLELLKNLLERISHRGPNNKDTYLTKDGKVGIGHSRLSVIDISSLGNQPMLDSSSRYIIAFNGEVYNYKELKKKYLNDFHLKSSSDTEVVLELYKIFKSKILDLLNGMFAFVIYDQLENELFIVRDHLGIKPLYYYQNNETFYFSSEFKSFLEIDKFDRSIDYSSLSDHLTFLRSSNQDTIFAKVKKILPGEFLIVKDAQIIEKKKYFQIENTFVKKDISFEEAKTKTLFLLENSVKQQLQSDIPVGCMLSGGVDSSSILSFAKKNSKKKIESFTINLNPNELKNDLIENDLPFAKEVSNSLDVKLNIININNDLEDLIHKMIYHLDEPIADIAAVHVYLISKLAKEHGYSVLLSGIGGDDLFSGYRRHEALFYETFYIFLPKSLLKFISYLTNKISFLPHRMKRLFLYSYLLNNDRLLSYYYWLNPDIVKEILLPNIKFELEKNSDLVGLSLKKLKSLDNLNFNNLDKMLYMEQTSFLPDHNLLYNDKMSMANGVETRVPFLDMDLIKFVNSVSNNFKLNVNKSKHLLKSSLSEILPKSIINRKKTGFGVPLRHWLDNNLKKFVDEFTSEKIIKKRGIFNYDKLKIIRQLNKDRKIDASYTIFSIVCYEIWSQKFIDKR